MRRVLKLCLHIMSCSSFFRSNFRLENWDSALDQQSMAVGLAIASEGGEYNGRMTLFVVLSCMMAAVGGVIFGYDIGNSGGITSMEPFLNKFFPEVDNKMRRNMMSDNYCKFDSQLLTSFTSSLYLAGFVSSFFASSVTQAYGRRLSILIGGVLFLIGGVIGGAALNVYMIILGRILLGVGVGFGNQAVPLYLSEMALPKYRGAINNGFQFSIGVGAISANLINFGAEKIQGGWGWRISLGLATVPALILTIGALLLPETPNSLIQRNEDREKTQLLLQRIRGTTDVQEELDDLIKASASSRSKDSPLKKITQRKYTPHLIMAISIPFFQQVTGINVIAFYAPVLFRTIGLGESASLLSAIMVSLIGTTSTLISMLTVDKFGRRFMLLFGGIQMLVTQVMIGGVLAVHLGDHGEMSKGYAYLVLTMIGMFVAGFNWSWGPVASLVSTEIFPLEIRSIGQSITVALSFLFTFVIAQTFLAMLCYFKSVMFFFFGGWLMLMTLFIYLLLPETKNIPIEKIERVWREHWFWRSMVEEDDNVESKI